MGYVELLERASTPSVWSWRTLRTQTSRVYPHQTTCGWRTLQTSAASRPRTSFPWSLKGKTQTGDQRESSLFIFFFLVKTMELIFHWAPYLEKFTNQCFRAILCLYLINELQQNAKISSFKNFLCTFSPSDCYKSHSSGNDPFVMSQRVLILFQARDTHPHTHTHTKTVICKNYSK